MISCVSPAGVLHVRNAARLLKTASVQVAKRRRRIAVARGSAGDLKTRRRFSRLASPVLAVNVGADGIPYLDGVMRSLRRDRLMRLITSTERLVHIDAGGAVLEGALGIVEGSVGLVVFAHGSGSSRHSPRNNQVARALREAGLSTLLIDLLTRDEDIDYETRFNIVLLSERLVAATCWIGDDEEARGMNIGYFGASTGAAAAITASIAMKDRVSAVVSRGGRPDLALDYISEVTAPTLLIVGGNDEIVIELNKKAYSRLRSEKDLVIIPGATHLFEEPGALDMVAGYASKWFVRHLGASVKVA